MACQFLTLSEHLWNTLFPAHDINKAAEQEQELDLPVREA